MHPVRTVAIAVSIIVTSVISPEDARHGAIQDGTDRRRLVDQRDRVLHGPVPGLISALAPAPFCCSRALHAKASAKNSKDRASGDDSDSAQLPMDRTVLLDKHLFLHRLYVGMDSCFGGCNDLHSMLARYLPDTSRVLKAASEDGVRAAREQWESNMARAEEAIRQAMRTQGVPVFQWSPAYRY